MKHLKKKYIHDIQLDPTQMTEIMRLPVDHNEVMQIVRGGMDQYYGIGISEDGYLMQMFKYQHGLEMFMIPEPNPIVIYFEMARFYEKALPKARAIMMQDIQELPGTRLKFVTGAHFYSYYMQATACALYLFLSLEAFINKAIPQNYNYSRDVRDKRTETYTKQQIQREIEFLEKIKTVIPEALAKNFVTSHGHKFDQIIKLKNYRDEIVHTKSLEGEMVPNFYEGLFNTSLKFDYVKTIQYTKDFINFYEPNLIEECPCPNPD